MLVGGFFVFNIYPMHYLLSILILFLSLNITAQSPLKKQYIQSEDSLRYENLLEELGKNKILPKGFELPALIALSYYPELKDVVIEFKFKKTKIAHTSQPKITTLLRARKKRTYQIIISNGVKPSQENTMLMNLPYNAQIGVLGHELAHTADYESMSNWKLMVLGIKYSFKKFRIRFERNTDQIAINHGVGYQLLAWSQSVYKLLEADGRGENYMKPKEIMEIIGEL